MDFKDSPEEAAFRAECRAWLKANAEPKTRADEIFGQTLTPEEFIRESRSWQRKKALAGFGAITWPTNLGGRGGTPMQEVIYRQEEGNFRVPVGTFNVSLGMVIPSVAAHASSEIATAHVGRALMGEELWCQLLSEPGAGSDLGMVRTRAERCDDGRDGWIINGQKVWTSLAQFSDFGLLLARTDPSRPKFEGLTTFYLAMDTPGVEIRPIRQAGGESEFNEVFFNNVFIPDSQRVGDLNKGWRTTVTGLMNERLSIGGVMPPELWRTAAQLLDESPFGAGSALHEGRLRQRLADLYLNAHGLWLLQCKGLTALSKGRQPGPELSVAKIVASRTLQDFAYTALGSQGMNGMLAGDELDERGRFIQRLWFGAAGMRIAGGTDEIVKNNVGERVLQLPPEPRSDKDLPFNQL